MLFEKCLFLVIEKLVCDGGHFEGFSTVIQGDNAVPHQDATFYKYVVNLCKEKQSMWEPQGPHMPQTNALDLAMFPEIFLRHIHFIRYLRGMRVSKEDEIWKMASKVWK